MTQSKVHESHLDSQNKRVCVIGLDGATFDVLDIWMNDGAMPNLAALIGRGSRMILKSIIPPVTGPAWTSMTTGVNPGVHGIFDFVKWKEGGLSSRVIRSHDVKVPRLWDVAGAQGRSVAVHAVPCIFPAPEVNGYSLSGMLTPSHCPEMVYPRSLYEELAERDLGVVDGPLLAVPEEDFIQRSIREVRMRVKELELLLPRHHPDLFFGVTIETDRVQHRLWPYCVKSAEGSNPKIQAWTREFYCAVDEFIGALVAHFGDDALYYMVSDHGFGPMTRTIRINTYLAQHGFVKVDWKGLRRQWRLRRVSRLFNYVLKRLGLVDDLFRRAAKKQRKKVADGNWRSVWEFERMTVGVDWKNTRAAAKSRSDAGIFVNDTTRCVSGAVKSEAERKEVVGALIEALEQLKDPETGQKIPVLTVRREEAFHGPHVHEAPDLLVFFDNGNMETSVYLGRPLIEPSDKKSGTHRLDGTLVVAGPGVRPGVTSQTSLMDISPTVLWSMGLPIPDHMEGRVLRELFAPEWIASHPERRETWKAPVSKPGEAARPYTAEEERVLEKRLKDLGYL